MKKVIAVVKLVRGNRGYFDPLTGMNLSVSNNIGYVREDDDTTNIRKAIRDRKIQIVGGQLPPTVDIKPKPVKEKKEKQEPIKVKKEKVEKIEKVEPKVEEKQEEKKAVVFPKVDKKEKKKLPVPVKEEVKEEVKEVKEEQVKDGE